MAQKFLTNIELEAGLVDGGNSTGTSGYLLSSTGTATSWIDPAAVSVGESEQVHIACKNTSGVAISKGDPVYITGTVGTSFRIEIAKADASDSAKMPAVGLAETDLGLNDEGFVIVSGVLKNLTTDPLSTSDGTPSSNDTVYVKVGGGLTKTKPTGSGNLIQNVGKVGRVSSANSGSLAVSTIMRTNDVPNLTTGKIWVGSPTYTTESTVVHLDETNGRMGIGTTSPQTPLHVEGLVRITESGNTAFYSGDYVRLFNSQAFDFKNSSSSVISRINLNGSSFFNGGNVGIGTTSPGAKLDVNGDVFINSNYPSNVAANDITIGKTTTGDHGLTIVTSSANTASIFFGDSDNNDAGRIKYQHGNNSMQFVTNRTEAMRIDSSGNVGIGTTSPDSTLHVESTGTTIGGYKYHTIVDDNNTYGINNGGGIVFRGNYNSSGAKANFGAIRSGKSNSNDGNANAYLSLYYGASGTLAEGIRLDYNGNVGIGTTSPSSPLTFGKSVYGGFDSENFYRIKLQDQGGTHNDVGIGQTASGNMGFNITSGNAFIFNNGTSGEIARFNGTGLGIGTTSPGYALSVNGDVQSDFFRSYQYPTSSFLDFDDDTTPGSNGTALVSVSSMKFIADSNNNGTTDAFSWIVDGLPGAGSTLMTLTDEGNLGIGTTSPAGKLTVVGSGGQANIESTGYILDLYRDNGMSSIYNSDNYGTLSLGAGGVENYLYVNWNGNVGIGTTSPSAKLDSIAPDGNTNSLRLGRLDSSNYWDFNHAGNDLRIYNTAGSGSDVLIGLNSGGIDQGNRVGIGTASPNARLHVYDTGNGEIEVERASGALVNIQAQSAKGLIGTDSNHTFSLKTNSSERLTILSSGNVGIGTTSPARKLSVAGAIELTVADTTLHTGHAAIRRGSGGEMFLDAPGDITVTIDSNNNQTNAVFNVRKDTGTELFRVQENGNVGIATTAPQTALQLYGTADDTTVGGAHRTAIRLTSTYASTFGGGGELQFGLAPSTAGRDALSVVKGTYSAYSSGNYGGDLEFHTRDADGLGLKQRMTIAHDGNVGINTTSPGATLEVVGRNSNTEAAFKVTDQGDRFFEVVPDFSTTFRLGDIDGLGDEPVIIGGYSDLKFNVAGSTTMTLDNNNRVGIGTTSPNVQLHVYSTGDTEIEVEKAAGALINIQAKNNKGSIGTDSNHALNLKTNSSDRLTISNTGNVGIGTTSPGAKLDIINTGGNATSLSLVQTYSGLTVKPYSAVDSKLTFSANSGNTQIIQATNNASTTGRQIALQPFGGNVGIGTTSPSAKLNVVGGDADFDSDNFIIRNNSSGNFGGRLVAHFRQGSDLIRFGDVEDYNTSASLDIDYLNQIANFRRMNLGVDVASPATALDVDGGIKMGNESSTASASLAGTLRYYTSGNNSYVDMCMQTGASTYAWVNIVTNSW